MRSQLLPAYHLQGLGCIRRRRPSCPLVTEDGARLTTRPATPTSLPFHVFGDFPFLARTPRDSGSWMPWTKPARIASFLLWVYVILPEHVHVLLWPRDRLYPISLIRTALQVPVQ